MNDEPFFICSDCGSNVLAVGHTWTKNANLEQVGYVEERGQYTFEKEEIVSETEDNHEWIAYCGGCGKGVTVEWLSDERLKLVLKESL
jgi:hypothetical protein